MTEATPIDDFAAAKAVYEQLRELSKDRQERVLRWVIESLGITPIPLAGAAIGTISQLSSPPIGDSMHGAGVLRQATAPIPDIRTFAAQKAPTSDNQFAAVVAYYYRFVAPEQDRKDSIGGAVLQEAARLAGRKRLANPRQTLANAKNMGYLDSPGRGEFTINSVGENLVALAMPGRSDGAAVAPGNSGNGNARKRTRPAKRPSTAARKAKH